MNQDVFTFLCFFIGLPAFAIILYVITVWAGAHERRHKRELEKQRGEQRLKELEAIQGIVAAYHGVTGVGVLGDETSNQLAEHLRRAFGLVSAQSGGWQKDLDRFEVLVERNEAAQRLQTERKHEEENFRLKRMKDARELIAECEAMHKGLMVDDIKELYEIASRPTTVHAEAVVPESRTRVRAAPTSTATTDTVSELEAQSPGEGRGRR